MALHEAIRWQYKDFGSYDKFVAEMKTAALTAFGWGWAWLSCDGKKQKLVVTKTTGEYLKEDYLELSVDIIIPEIDIHILGSYAMI